MKKTYKVDGFTYTTYRLCDACQAQMAVHKLEADPITTTWSCPMPTQYYCKWCYKAGE